MVWPPLKWRPQGGNNKPTNLFCWFAVLRIPFSHHFGAFWFAVFEGPLFKHHGLPRTSSKGRCVGISTTHVVVVAKWWFWVATF